MKNIFENAYFGKAYKTRDGRKAIYITCVNKDFNSYPHVLVRDVYNEFYYYNDSGKILLKYEALEYDIVSEWCEEINNEEIVKKACEWLEECLPNIEYITTSSATRLNKNEFIEQFKKAMK